MRTLIKFPVGVFLIWLGSTLYPNNSLVANILIVLGFASIAWQWPDTWDVIWFGDPEGENIMEYEVFWYKEDVSIPETTWSLKGPALTIALEFLCLWAARSYPFTQVPWLPKVLIYIFVGLNIASVWLFYKYISSHRKA